MNLPELEHEVTFGEVSFSIKKLMPMEAKEVFVGHVRPLLRGLNAEMPNSQEVASKGEDFKMMLGFKMMLAAFTEAPEAHYKAIVKAMSKRITFTSPSNKSPLTLAGNEELAFKDLDMAHILLLEGRAFGVNFFGSCSILFEEFMRLFPSSPLPDPQT